MRQNFVLPPLSLPEGAPADVTLAQVLVAETSEKYINLDIR